MSNSSDITASTYSYWDSSDELFQEKFTKREEFRQLELPAELESKPGYGEYYKQQILIARYLQIWDYVTIDHDPGVGKTDAAVLAAMMFNIGMGLDASVAYLRGLCNYIEGIVIFTPSSTVDITWISSFERQGNRVPSNVRIHHYEEFYIKYVNNIPGAIAELNHKFIVFDEVQRALSRSKVDRERDRYDFYVAVLEATPVKKIALETGSLLTIDTIELAYVVNLLPRGTALKMPEDDLWHNTLKTTSNDIRDRMLKPYLNGIVSRLKSVPKYSKAVWPAEAVSIGIPGSNFYRVVELTMSKKHSEAYRKAASTHTEFNQGALRFSVFGLQVKNNNEESITIEQIQTYGPIIAHAMNVVRNNPHKKIFIVTHWLQHGILPMKRALQLLGYNNINILAKGTQGIKGIFPETQGLRYGVLESTNESKTMKGGSVKSSGQNIGIINYFNHDRNYRGDYLQVILSSEVGTTSISLYGAEIVMLLDPGSQLQMDLQRKERVFRAAGSEHLYSLRRSQGMSAEQAIVPIVVYHYSINDPHSNGSLYSATMNKYQDNARRDLVLDPIRRSEQRLAFDAQLMAARNGYAESLKGDISPGFFGRDVRYEVSDKKVYEAVYSDLKEEIVLKHVVRLLMDAYNINVDLFVENYSQQYNINSDKVYRLLSKLVDNPRLITTDVGEPVYVHLDSSKCYLYISPEKFTTPANNTLAIYTNPHRVLLLKDLIRRNRKTTRFPTWSDLNEFLDSTLKDVQNKNIIDRINEIELILLEGASNPFYKNLINKYPRSIRLITKPVDVIHRLSFLESTKRKAASNMVIETETIGAETVLMHVFRAQRDLERNSTYNVLSAHLSAKSISVIDTRVNNFVVLSVDSPEHVAYSSIISRDITQDFHTWISNYEDIYSHYTNLNENELTIGQQRSLAMMNLYGVYFRPENVFRIQDNRDRPIVYTSQHEINKSLTAKTKKYFSSNIEDFLDMIVYLRIEEDFLARVRGDVKRAMDDFIIQLNALKGTSYKDILRLIIREIPSDVRLDTLETEAGIDTQKILITENLGPITTVKTKTRTQKTRSSIVLVLLDKKAYYQQHPDRFAVFYLLYKNKDKPDSPAKDDHCRVIETHLRESGRIYEFI